jgi:hypothetical protein
MLPLGYDWLKLLMEQVDWMMWLASANGIHIG